ncbi:MAG: FAD-dependent oxidoreductase [Candidatus Marinimicrobia bacterium]|nr:FAD-dependent oxidoreductase [Candidatus Neomarinimicrobiota bacterium]
MKSKREVVIIGGGMVGLSIAYQLMERNISNNIALIEKEKKIGLHSSGRNSGVIHAGLYYKPNTLKAKVCVKGGIRLKEWMENHKLKINNCGKVIVPTSPDLDGQLDLLYERGKENGAFVEFIDNNKLKELVPFSQSITNRALWSPNTSVVNPKEIIETLRNELVSKGLKIFTYEKSWDIDVSENLITLTDGSKISYDYLFNSAGLWADKIAHKFNLGKEYLLIPFKGNYWDIKKNSKIKIETNLYPVPDLNLPFLGVHFSPNSNNTKVSIGPTATLAFGRENYNIFDSIEISNSFKNITLLINQYLQNKLRFREYVHNQAFLSFQPFLLNEARKLVPGLLNSDIEISQKIGIRPQLFNLIENKIEDDFIYINSRNSTHIINAISPAFTSSFALGDLIIDRSNLY